MRVPRPVRRGPPQLLGGGRGAFLHGFSRRGEEPFQHSSQPPRGDSTAGLCKAAHQRGRWTPLRRRHGQPPLSEVAIEGGPGQRRQRDLAGLLALPDDPDELSLALGKDVRPVELRRPAASHLDGGEWVGQHMAPLDEPPVQRVGVPTTRRLPSAPRGRPRRGAARATTAAVMRRPIAREGSCDAGIRGRRWHPRRPATTARARARRSPAGSAVRHPWGSAAGSPSTRAGTAMRSRPGSRCWCRAHSLDGVNQHGRSMGWLSSTSEQRRSLGRTAWPPRRRQGQDRSQAVGCPGDPLGPRQHERPPAALAPQAGASRLV